MRARAILALAALAAIATPAQALTITARVSGGTINVYEGPGRHYPVIGRLADGTEIPVDQCTQVDSDSGSFGWGSGHLLRPSGWRQWCRIPDYGWVDRAWIVGRGLVNVTPPDFSGPGW